MKLFTYFRSSASYRVRIALNIKELEYSAEYVHLLRNGGEQHSKAYRAKNPQGLVPTLVDEKEVFIQSLAIIEYLEEKHPEPTILPDNPKERAIVRAMSQILVSDTLPLVNLRVLQYLNEHFSMDETKKLQWIHEWMHKGLMAYEACIKQYSLSGSFTLGERPTLADICLIPFVYNALRYNLDMSAYPRVIDIYKHAIAQPAFLQASPFNQEDAYAAK